MAKTVSQRNRNNRERGKEFERKIAKLLGFVRVPYSGSSEVYGEGDVRDHKDPDKSFYLGECKSMTPKSKAEVNYIIKAEWLNAITKRSKKGGRRLWFLAFTKVADPKAYSITSMEDFKMLIQALDICRYGLRGAGVNVSDVDALRQDISRVWGGIYGQGEADADESGDIEG